MTVNKQYHPYKRQHAKRTSFPLSLYKQRLGTHPDQRSDDRLFALSDMEITDAKNNQNLFCDSYVSRTGPIQNGRGRRVEILVRVVKLESIFSGEVV